MDLGARPKTTLLPPPLDPLEDDDSAITALPDEILEHILSLISPYRDLESSALVCRRWLSCCRRVISHRLTHFSGHVLKGGLLWTHQPTLESATTITKRYSHCAVYHAASCAMFVFGGCTSTSSTFNDLWQLDLSSRTWRRPLAMGTYPSPKACATLVLHEDTLVLFGGWTHPSLYPLHQSWKLFSELHVYHIQESRWSQVQPAERPPAMAGHSATVHGEAMVVFGGLHKQRSIGHYTSSSDVWTFNLELQTWEKIEIEGDEKPSPRYGQSQIYLDQHHLLVLGGCGGPNNEFTDIWLLRMGSLPWGWVQMDIRGEDNRAKDIWCHPACRVGDKVVVLGKNKVVSATSAQAQASQQPATGGNQAWNVIPQLRRGINRGTGAIRRGGAQRPGFGSAPAPHHQSRNDESHWRSAQDSSDSDMEIAVEPVPSLPRSQPPAGAPSLPRSQASAGPPSLPRSQPPVGAFRLQPLTVGVRGRGGPSSTIVRPESSKTSPSNEPSMSQQISAKLATPNTTSPAHHNQERSINLPSPPAPTFRSMINVNIPPKPSPMQSPPMSQKAFGSSFSPIQSPSNGFSPSGAMPGRWETSLSPSSSSGPNAPFPPPTASSFPPPTPASAASALIPVKITAAHAKSFGPGANTGMTDPSISGPRPNSSSPSLPPPDHQIPGTRPGAPGTPDFTQQPFHNQKNRQKILENRQRQLATLQRMEDRIRNSPRSSPAGPKTAPSSANSVCPRHRMTTFILDISTAISDHYVMWLPVTASSSLTAPPESILYSLVQGRTELIMFGGLQKDISLGAGRGGQQNNTETVSNCLYYLNPPADVI